MRIGIDAHVLGKGIGGVERFLAHLVPLLPDLLPGHRLIVFVDAKAVKRVTLPQAENLEVVTMAVSNPLIERSLLLPWLVHRHRIDALLVQRVAPWFCGRCKLVVTIHDITPLKYPAAYRGLNYTLVRLLTPSSAHRARLILTPTQVIADEVSQKFGISADRIVPFYNGVDTASFHPRPQAVPQPYIFISGAIEARKNLETVLRARALLGDTVPWRLMIAGGTRDAAYKTGLEALSRELGIAHLVDWLGFVDEARLVELYQGAAAFITASRDEGFNIPPLEAIACGCPTLCSDIAVHRELFTNAVLFFPTEAPEALAAALRRVHAEAGVREQLASAGADCVARLSWPAMAARVAAALTTLASSS